LYLRILLLLAIVISSLPAQSIIRPLKADLPPQDEIRLRAVTQDSNGPMRYLRGASVIETTEMKISADDIDFNSDTDWAYARGHVHMDHYSTGEKINADHAEYNLQTEEGKFWNVNGTSPAKIMTNPGTLTTTNPFYFQALWADRIKDRYILHKGFITDCKIPKPWWIFQAPTFDIIPGNRAIARHSVFRLHGVPIMYLPYYYRPLGRNPRQSGFLTPNFGNSTFYGYIYGEGYYWAINPSYDMTGVVEYFTQRGPAISYNFRGKPNQVTDFNFNAYDVEDRGVPLGNGAYEQQGGREFQVTARTQIAGFTGRLNYNYLSSLLFREAFSYNFATAIYNEVDSIGFLQRRFRHDSYTLNFIVQQNQVFQSVTLLNQTPNQVILQKLPSAEFLGRDQNIAPGPVPVWFSFASSASLLLRSEPTGAITSYGPPAAVFHTDPYSRFDVEPHVQTSFRWAGFSLTPGLSLGLTSYSNSYATNSTTYTPVSSCGGYPSCTPNSTVSESLSESSLLRKNADFTLDLHTPTLERIYTPPKWLRLGGKVKHVIEAEAKYEYVTGINEFQRIIHYDETDILSNTNQLTFYLNNRLYRKDAKGNVAEILTWRLAYARYYDPTFGGAVLPGVRNVVLATEELTPFAFLDGPRSYSPITSSLVLTPLPLFSFEWRTDYDPLRRKFIDQFVGVTIRKGKYFASMGESAITTLPILVPQANQISFGGGYGSANRRGWNIGGTSTQDLLLSRTLFQNIQASYNTDCCGFSFQLRRTNFGIRNDNQYLFSFSLANLGTFGSLQRQERVF
jgi:LPS-assembly protein